MKKLFLSISLLVGISSFAQECHYEVFSDITLKSEPLNLAALNYSTEITKLTLNKTLKPLLIDRSDKMDLAEFNKNRKMGSTKNALPYPDSSLSYTLLESMEIDSTNSKYKTKKESLGFWLIGHHQETNVPTAIAFYLAKDIKKMIPKLYNLIITEKYVSDYHAVSFYCFDRDKGIAFTNFSKLSSEDILNKTLFHYKKNVIKLPK